MARIFFEDRDLVFRERLGTKRGASLLLPKIEHRSRVQEPCARRMREQHTRSHLPKSTKSSPKQRDSWHAGREK
jgi:hypothetical protein